jgi:hypothetical protein
MPARSSRRDRCSPSSTDPAGSSAQPVTLTNPGEPDVAGLRTLEHDPDLGALELLVDHVALECMKAPQVVRSRKLLTSAM